MKHIPIMRRTEILLKRVAILLLMIVLSGCKTGNVPKFKEYVPEEKLINIKGVHVSELTSQRKNFKLEKSLKKDMKNSLDLSRIGEIYGNYENAYKEAVKHHLIKTTAVNVKSYSYDEVKYDETYAKSNIKHNITYYYYSEGDTLKFIQEDRMQIVPLQENIFTGDASHSEYMNEALVRYTCAFHYYPNGSIRHYSCSLRKATAGSRELDLPNMPIGTESAYDESGNLVMTVNHEEDFKIDFSTIFTIALKGRNELVEKYKISGLNGVGILYISRNKNKHGSFWIIPYPIGSKRLVYRIIDDQSGKIAAEFEDNDELLKKYTEKTEENVKKITELRKSFK